MRRGKVVAQLDPVHSGRGAEVKALLRRHRLDPGFAEDVVSARELLEIETRPLSRLLLDTTFLVDADRSGSSLEDLIADEDEVAVAAITIAELLVGVHLADRQPSIEHARGSSTTSQTSSPSSTTTQRSPHPTPSYSSRCVARDDHEAPMT